METVTRELLAAKGSAVFASLAPCTIRSRVWQDFLCNRL